MSQNLHMDLLMRGASFYRGGIFRAILKGIRRIRMLEAMLAYSRTTAL